MGVMTGIALALMVTGTAMQVKGQLDAGKAAKRAGQKGQEAANSQAELMDFNANIAEMQAGDAVDRGADDESRFRTQVRGAIGAQRAGFAAANIDVGFGSAVDVQADAALLGELDALTIRSNAAREAWGYKVQATDLRKRGEITRKEGVNIAEAGRQGQTAARWGAATTVVGNSGSLLAQKYGMG